MRTVCNKQLTHCESPSFEFLIEDIYHMHLHGIIYRNFQQYVRNEKLSMSSNCLERLLVENTEYDCNETHEYIDAMFVTTL